MHVISLNIAPQLRPYIHSALWIQRNETGGYVFNMIPRLYPCIILPMEQADGLEVMNRDERLLFERNQLYFGGAGDALCRFSIPSKMDLLLVLFHPHSTGLFWKEDALHFADHPILITDTSRELYLLNEKINNAGSVIQKWQSLQTFMIQKMTCKPARNLVYVTRAVELIYRSAGRVDIKTLAKEAYTCQRNLLDSFRQHVGIAPKRFTAMVRFNAVAKELTNYTGKYCLQEKAVEYGYHDLSHLYKDFSRYLGKVPNTFLEQKQEINALV